MKQPVVPLFFADDKAVYDLLVSSKRYGQKRLLEIARKRGLVLSQDSTREAIAKQLALLDYDWPQLTDLVSHVESPDRAEKWSWARLVTTTEITRVTDSLSAIIEERSSSHEVYRLTREAGTNVVRLFVQYTDLNEGLTLLRQNQQREVELRIDVLDTGEVRIRHQTSKLGAQLVEELRAKLSDEDNEVVNAEISLFGIQSFGTRTKFFTDLFTIPGYKVEDVRKVSTAQHVTTDPDEEDDDEDELEVKDTAATGIVKTLALNGSNVVTSPEYKALIAKRFIHRAVWRARDTRTPSVLIEFEAGFRNPGAGTGFEVSIRRMWEMNAKTRTFKKSPAPANILAHRRPALLKLVEERAQTLHAAITAAVDKAAAKKSKASKKKKPAKKAGKTSVKAKGLKK